MSEKNELTRLEAFCDGVFAIAITLLILEIKIPPLASIHSIKEFWHSIIHDWPSWFAFTLSFIVILIAWANHHMCSQVIDKSSPAYIYANGFLLFTVVILPFTTGLMAEYLETAFAQPAISLYCLSMLLHNIAWIVLTSTMLRPHHPLTCHEAGYKKVSLTAKSSRSAFLIYLAIFILSFWFPVIALVLMTSSWISWLVLSIATHPKHEVV